MSAGSRGAPARCAGCACLDDAASGWLQFPDKQSQAEQRNANGGEAVRGIGLLGIGSLCWGFARSSGWVFAFAGFGWLLFAARWADSMAIDMLWPLMS
jgi:hypothetical protein